MPGPDTAVEESGPIIALYLALYSALIWIVLRGMRGGWMYSIGYILHKLASVSIPFPKVHLTGVGISHIHPLAFLDDVNNYVLNALETQAAAYERSMGKWFHAAAGLQLW